MLLQDLTRLRIWLSVPPHRKQWSLACCSPWGSKKLDMTQWLNNNNRKQFQFQSHVRDEGDAERRAEKHFQCSVLLRRWHIDILEHQFSSVTQSCLTVTPWIAERQASLSITNSRSSLKLMSIKSVMPSRCLSLCHPLLLLPPIPPSIRVFSNDSTLRMTWPKYWNFSFSISPPNEHPGLISFRMDWLDLLAVQGTLKSLL